MSKANKISISITLFSIVLSIGIYFYRMNGFVVIPLERRSSEAIAYTVDLNTANQRELINLPGIGPSLAQKIIDHRLRIKGFSSIEELDEIPGIGAKKLSKLQKYLQIDSPTLH